MYGKFFASAFTGSMMASGAEVFAVWAYVIANAVNSRVELNPALLAAVIGSTPDRMAAAIEKLCAPDANSRSPGNEGRRLIREGQFQYYIPNHEKYRSIRNEDERREYNREAKRRERAKSAGVKPGVIDMSAVSAHTEAEAETKPKPLRAAGAAPGGFERFWKAWPNSPRKVGKAACLKKWQAHKLEEVSVLLVNHVETMKRTDQWKRGFEPAPLTYLNQRRWEDGDPGETPPGEKPWFITQSGVRDMGAQLGMGSWDEIEPFPSYRDRVLMKAGITKSQYDSARKEWGV